MREAILTGDALLALATRCWPPCQTSTTAVTRLAAIRDLLCGQQSDLSFERRTDVELAECLAMVKHKTAALMCVSCELGALLGGAPPESNGSVGRELAGLYLRNCPLSTQETSRAIVLIERAGGRDCDDEQPGWNRS